MDCSCTVTADNITIQTPFLCRSSEGQITKVTHVIPAAWTKLDSLVVDHTPTLHDNLTQIMNMDWHLEAPVIILTENMGYMELDYSRPHQPASVNQGELDVTWIHVWLGVLSVLIMYLLWLKLKDGCQCSCRPNTNLSQSNPPRVNDDMCGPREFYQSRTDQPVVLRPFGDLPRPLVDLPIVVQPLVDLPAAPTQQIPV